MATNWYAVFNLRIKSGILHSIKNQQVTSAISSADGSELSVNHIKNVLAGPCLRFLLCPFCADCAFWMRSMFSFQFTVVDCEAGSPVT